MSREHPLPPHVGGLQVGGGLPDHRAIPGPLPAPLDVVCAISNPFRYESRFNLYRAWERRMLDAGVRLTTVECAFGERPFEVTQEGVRFDTTEGRIQYVQYRTGHILWLKENLLNLGISRLPADWKYVAWIDGDVNFARPDWAQECLHLLQHYEVIQLFSHYVNLDYDSRPSPSLSPSPAPETTSQSAAPMKSLMAAVRDGDLLAESGPGPSLGYGYYGSGPLSFIGAHPGFAWAARRDAINTLGGLYDTAILGAGDTHMAYALLGNVDRLHPPDLSTVYQRNLKIYEARAKTLRRNLGVMPGLLLHHFHGPIAARGYNSRWRVLLEWGYDPDLDLMRDSQMLYQLTNAREEQSIGLRDGIARYFSQRDEDARS